MHCNVIARKTIAVDGKLDDWEGVLPQTVVSKGTQRPTLQEFAWQPFKQFDSSTRRGLATAYVAYDDRFFYFAAKVADETPETGMIRYETSTGDEFFYPAKYTDKAGKELVWPEGVRRYSYRRDPDLPAGNAPNHDNIQIAFNVVPEEDKPWLPNPPGTAYHFTGYWCTDYEFALNPVAAKYGGGTEMWRLRAPNLPDKHYYPRQPKAPGEGAVKDGKLVVTRVGGAGDGAAGGGASGGGMRITECAIPWSEIPHAKKRLAAGQTIKFSFRVNDNAGVGCMELSRERSVAKRNGSFKVDWAEHWANEVEFGFAK
jgi:hypothetical protein